MLKLAIDVSRGKLSMIWFVAAMTGEDPVQKAWREWSGPQHFPMAYVLECLAAFDSDRRADLHCVMDGRHPGDAVPDSAVIRSRVRNPPTLEEVELMCHRRGYKPQSSQRVQSMNVI